MQASHAQKNHCAWTVTMPEVLIIIHRMNRHLSRIPLSLNIIKINATYPRDNNANHIILSFWNSQGRHLEKSVDQSEKCGVVSTFYHHKPPPNPWSTSEQQLKYGHRNWLKVKTMLKTCVHVECFFKHTFKRFKLVSLILFRLVTLITLII